MTTLRIIKCDEWDSLYCHYERQTQPQGCYVELCCKTGVLHAEHNPEIGGAIPFSVYHGHDRRWGIPCLTADAANALLDEIAPLAQRILDGYDAEWDGNNMVAVLNAEAQSAEHAIEAACDIEANERNSVSAVEAADWLTSSIDGLAADSTDTDLDAMAVALEGDAEVELVVLRGCRDYLEHARQEMRDEVDA